MNKIYSALILAATLTGGTSALAFQWTGEIVNPKVKIGSSFFLLYVYDNDEFCQELGRNGGEALSTSFTEGYVANSDIENGYLVWELDKRAHYITRLRCF